MRDMEPQDWLEISIAAAPEELETLCAQLAAAGMEELVIEDEGEFLAFLEETRPYWNEVDRELLERMRGVSRVKFYVSDDEVGRAALLRYTQGLHREYTAVKLREKDWAYSWQKYYRPMAVGERLYILPEWEREAAVPPGRTAVLLNPGLTFGTGSHASTRLCLEGVEAHVRPGDQVLDLGCGSGILSIAALCLGAGEAWGVDLDPKAAKVALENAALNGLGPERCHTRTGNVLSDEDLREDLARRRYALVLANIVPDVIIPLSAYVPRLLGEGGVFLCSGIIDTRKEEVLRALEENGFALLRERTREGWVELEARLA